MIGIYSHTSQISTKKKEKKEKKRTIWRHTQEAQGERESPPSSMHLHQHLAQCDQRSDEAILISLSITEQNHDTTSFSYLKKCFDIFTFTLRAAGRLTQQLFSLNGSHVKILTQMTK